MVKNTDLPRCRIVPRRYGVQKVHLTPQDSGALHLGVFDHPAI
jgi:hypothetical protein